MICLRWVSTLYLRQKRLVGMGVQNTKILLFSITSLAPLIDRNRPLLPILSRRNHRHYHAIPSLPGNPPISLR